MKRYRVTATLESPLVVRKERQSQRSEGADSVSGTLLRGALAQAYLHQHGAADAGFHRLFLDEDACRYGPLDPADRVFPQTAVSCKRKPGFRDDGEPDDEKHGVGDVLWARVARRLAGREVGGDDASLRRCRKCRQDLKGLTGFWIKKEGKYHQPRKPWRLAPAIHVGIDRTTATAAEAMFYSLPALEPREQTARLVGDLEAEPDVIEALNALLADEEGVVRVGHARTRGCGRVRLDIGDAAADGGGDWEGWSAALIAYLAKRDAGSRFDPARHFFFGLSLPTGAILLDKVLRYSLDPAGMVDWLPRLSPGGADREAFGGRLRCVHAVTKHERLRGWNAAHGLPRQDEWLVSRGAVYAYLFEGDAAGRGELTRQLAALERAGVGARRGEGFGRVRVSDDFHRTFAEQEGRP